MESKNASLMARENRLVLASLANHRAFIGWRDGSVVLVGFCCCRGLSTTLNKDVPLQRIFARETLVAVTARERLDRQVDPLMTLQVMVPVEALRALIALERAIVRWCLVSSRMCLAVDVAHTRRVPAVRESGHHAAVVHATDQRELAVRVVDVRKDGSGERIALVRPLVRKWRVRGSRLHRGDLGRAVGRRHPMHACTCA